MTVSHVGTDTGRLPAPDRLSTDALGARRVTTLDLAMLGSLVLLVGGVALSARLAAGWRTAIPTYLISALYLCLLLVRPMWRPLLTRLLLFAAIAGVLELATDFSGEYVVHSLFYPPHEPMLWASPVYMPVSWMVVLSQIGYLAWRLRGLAPLWLAMLLTALWGALNIPLYEELAYSARWWHYAQVRPIGHTPLYVVLFEGLVAGALPLLLTGLPHVSYRVVTLRGVVLGAWIPCAAFLAWLALGR